MADARWIEEYDRTALECAAAAAAVALEPSPRVWPVSGAAFPDLTWNPGGAGHRVSVDDPPDRVVDPMVHDERTKDLPKNPKEHI